MKKVIAWARDNFLYIAAGLIVLIAISLLLHGCGSTPTGQSATGQWVDGLDEFGKNVRVWVNITGQAGTPWGVIALGVSGLATAAGALLKTLSGDKGHSQNVATLDNHDVEIAALKAELAALKAK